MPDYKFHNLRVGDVLYLQPTGNNARRNKDGLQEGIVSSIKRKYAYVDLPWKKGVAVALATGIATEKGDCNAGWRAWRTRDDYDSHRTELAQRYFVSALAGNLRGAFADMLSQEETAAVYQIFVNAYKRRALLSVVERKEGWPWAFSEQQLLDDAALQRRIVDAMNYDPAADDWEHSVFGIPQIADSAVLKAMEESAF